MDQHQQDQQELTKEQRDALRDQLERGQAFEELSHTKGFSYQKAYLENLLRSFVNDVMNAPERPLAEFESQRQQIIGLKKLMGEIEWGIKTLQNERQTKRPTSK